MTNKTRKITCSPLTHYILLYSSLLLFSHSVMSDSFASPCTVAHQALLSMGFSRQEYCSVLPFASPGDLLDPGIEPGSPSLQANSLSSEPPGKARGSPIFLLGYLNYLSFQLYMHRDQENNRNLENFLHSYT